MDPGFNPDINGSVNVIAPQPDRKVVVGGAFTVVSGVERSRLARLNQDGTVDQAFNPDVLGTVYAAAIQADGKILIGGEFNVVGSAARVGLARLNPDGTVDAGFDAGLVAYPIYSISVQPDGRIIVAGNFFWVGGDWRNNIARLNPDGTLDSTFVGDVNGSVYATAMQTDGRILIGGWFNSVGGASRNFLARLNPDGTVDDGFNPDPSLAVQSIATQADGKILIGGDFTTVGGVPRNRIARLNADGTLDAAFNPDADQIIYSVSVQADARILIAGGFNMVDGIERHNVARLNPDGTLDATFDSPQPNGFFHSVALQPDGKVLLGGSFSSLGGVPRNSLARLDNDPTSEGLTVQGGGRVEWLRGGSSPDASGVTFDLTADGGASYTPLGPGSRIAGGWELPGLTLPASGHIRARGRTHGGQYNGSTGLVQTLIPFGGASSDPEISVSGNGIEISTGDLTPGVSDLTDFGAVNVAAGAIVRRFAIANIGTANLVLGSPGFTGPGAAAFSLATPPDPIVPPGGSTTLIVAFHPVSVGSQLASLIFTSNDTDENPFTFAIQAAGVVSSDASLAGLTLSNGTLSPAFTPGTTSYAANVPYTVGTLRLTPTQTEPNATIQVRVNGGPYQTAVSGSASAPLVVGEGSNTIEVLVSAQDGTTKRTYTITVNRAAAVPGNVDLTFDANAVAFAAYATAIQADGKTLVWGELTSFGGVPRNSFARLSPDGSLDLGFDPNPNGVVGQAIVQPDGRILIAGNFSSVGGVPTQRIARLNVDGTLDGAFNCACALNNSGVFMALQADGKILLGGNFTTVGGVPRVSLARLNADGGLDSDFNPGANALVSRMIVQEDGKILLSGLFTTVAGVTRSKLARLQPDGTFDAAFSPPSAFASLAGLQADGRILLTTTTSIFIGGTLIKYLGRVDADGSLDATFHPDLNNSVSGAVVDTDGKILAWGDFTSVGGVGRNRVALLHADGILDGTFLNPDPSFMVRSASQQADGKVILAGQFATVGGVSRNRIARLMNDAANQTLTVTSDSRVEWLRGGASPEVHQVIFEASTDGGVSYTALGAGTRVSGGWEITGLGLPPSGLVRGRAQTAGGTVEAVSAFPAPEITISSNGTIILSGDGTPSLADHTDFGVIPISGGLVTRTFTVSNHGMADLSVGNVAISGVDAASFIVTAQPASPIGGGTSATFQVAFDPITPVLHTATLSLVNSDSDESPFEFTIHGTGVDASNADLAALTLSKGTLTPDFAAETLAYTAGVGFNTASLSLTPTRAQADATIQVRVDGGPYAAVTSGTPSSPLSLNVGANTVEVLVTALDGTTTKEHTVTITRAAIAPGDVEPGFNPNWSGTVFSTSLQPDGRIVIGGVFIVGGNVARLNPDGTQDSGFAPDANNVVWSTAVQTDGRILIGGAFTTVGGVSRNYVARLNPDGSLDPGFDPGANGQVHNITVQADGKILLGGIFTAVAGVTRPYVARLNPDGTLDSGFDPNPNNGVYTIAVQPDGGILIGGGFTLVGGTTRQGLARLNGNGVLDTGFNPEMGGSPIHTVAAQADGRILIAGLLGAAVPGGRLARLNADGSRDADFNPNVNNWVYNATSQTDGKILIAGEFTSVGGVARNYLARLNADGTLDAAFDPNPNAWVYSTTLQEDGKVVLGGNFTAVGGVARSYVARVENNPATQSLTVPNANRIQWLRGGSSPESVGVTFDLSTDGGGTYVPMGTGARILDGWELTGLTLPSNGLIRARARPVGGYGSGSGSLIETVAAFSGLLVPEITVTGNSINISNGDGTPDLADHTDFGAANTAGASVVRTFTLTNTGTTDLTVSDVSVGGLHPSDFIVTSQPAPSIAPGDSTSLEVTFDPNAVGTRGATLTFTNNAFDKSPFGFSIQGTGVVSGNAFLSGLTLSRGALSPGFAAATTTYTAGVGFNVSSLTVTPNAADTHASVQVRVNGGAYANVASGGPSAALALNVGANPVDILVTAQDGATTATYTVTVTRAPIATGDVDPTFNPDSNNSIYGLAVQPDGKVLIGGDFATLGGVNRNRLARFNLDGSLDLAFNPSPNSFVSAMAVQDDDRIVIGGVFGSVGGVTRNLLARIQGDGTLDTAFNPNLNGPVQTLQILNDGGVFVAGGFTTVGGVVRNHIARINPDGSLDEGFNPGADLNVYSSAIQPDGKIIIGGDFTTVGGAAHSRLARLNVDGTVDATFNPSASSTVYTIAVQADGKILIGGQFSTVWGVTRVRLARLHADGTLDTTFNPGTNFIVFSISVQADTKIMLGGTFSSVAGTARTRLARLNQDGTVDPTFNPDVNDPVYTIRLQADGKLLVGGYFTSVGGVPRNRAVRLQNDPATQSLTVPSAGRIQWLRGGSSPESHQVTFELSTDGGTTYSRLGAGLRISGGFELTGLALPAGGQIRARARTSENDSSGLMETLITYAGLPVPEIAVTGNGVDIGEGDSTPNAADHTDFGSASIPGLPIVRTFNITNTGTATLSVGSVTVSGVNASDFAVSSQPASTVGAGASTSFQVTFEPGATGVRAAVLSFTNNDFDEAAFNFSVHGAGVLAPGEVDPTFNPNASLDVSTTTVQPDGRIVVGGSFSTIGGAGRNFVARLNADGTLDTGFNPGSNNTVLATLVLPDGKLLLSGYLTNVGGLPRNNIARLNADGTPDPDFNPNANDIAYGMARQGDGNIVITGYFTSVGGVIRNRVARLHADGTLDPTFNPDADNSVYNAMVLPDGKILIVGDFTTVSGVARSRLARLNPDGTVDPAFNPDVNFTVVSLAVQADGKILIGGFFTEVAGVTRHYIARLNADGSLDTGFGPEPNGQVWSMALQADGKIIIVGSFTSVGGIPRNNIARLNPNGTPDSAFNPGANDQVRSAALQADGKILLGGAFTSVGGVARNRIARLENYAATQTLSVPSQQRIEWLRGGASPETLSVNFELSINGGGVYTALGDAARIPGGWELTGLELPQSGMIRARARTSGGIFAGSGGLVETVQAFEIVAPSLSPATSDSITATSARLSAEVTSDGGSPVTERGFVYSVEAANSNPLIGGASVSQVVVPGAMGVFSTKITALVPTTTYVFKAYATNGIGTTYSASATFSTPEALGFDPLTARNISINSVSGRTLGPSAPEVWYRARLFASRSYQLSAWPVDSEQSADAPALSLTAFSDDEGTILASGAAGTSGEREGTPNQPGDGKPFTLSIKPPVTGVYKIRVQRLSGGPNTVNVMLRETTLFSPWASRAAGFEAFIELHNNTNAAVTVTLHAFDGTGALQGEGLTLILQPNATEVRTATQAGLPVNAFAGIVLTHDGSFGAVSGNVTTLSGANGLSFDSPFTPRDSSVQTRPIR